MGIGAGLCMFDVVVKSSRRSLSHFLMSKYEVRTTQSDSTLTFSGIKCQGYKDRLKRHVHVRSPNLHKCERDQTRMWANAQCDGRPAEYRWRPLFNAAVWLTPTTGVPCNNAAKARKPLKLAGVPPNYRTN